MIYFLLSYVFFLLLFAGYSAAGIYHLMRFGYVGDLTRPIVWIYILISIAIIVVSVALILTRSWPTTITFT